MLSRHGVIDKPGRAEEQEQLKSRIELDNEIEEIKRRQQQQVMMMVVMKVGDEGDDDGGDDSEGSDGGRMFLILQMFLVRELLLERKLPRINISSASNALHCVKTLLIQVLPKPANFDTRDQKSSSSKSPESLNNDKTIVKPADLGLRYDAGR